MCGNLETASYLDYLLLGPNVFEVFFMVPFGKINIGFVSTFFAVPGISQSMGKYHNNNHRRTNLPLHGYSIKLQCNWIKVFHQIHTQSNPWLETHMSVSHIKLYLEMIIPEHWNFRTLQIEEIVLSFVQWQISISIS